jgi:hypothetical protein
MSACLTCAKKVELEGKASWKALLLPSWIGALSSSLKGEGLSSAKVEQSAGEAQLREKNPQVRCGRWGARSASDQSVDLEAKADL